MSLWTRLKRGVGRRLKEFGDSVGSELRDTVEGWGWSGAGMPVNSFTAMQQTAVMACTMILSEDVAKLPVRVWHRTANGGKELAPTQPLDKLLRQPNAWQTRMEFMEQMQASLVLRGNAFAPILRSVDGTPTALVAVHPDRVTLYEAPDSRWYWAVARSGLHETAALRDFSLLIPAEDMLHVKTVSTWNSLLGASRISMLRETVGLAMSLDQHMARFTSQGGRASGILKSPKRLSDTAIAHMRNEWAEQQAGWRNAGKPLILEEGTEWEQLQMTMADAEFLASRRYQLEDIARGFRVPLHKLGIADATAGPALVQRDQSYLNDVISTYCDLWKLRLERTFGLDGDEYFIEFDYSHFIKADIQTRIQAMRAGVLGMIFTPNEARREEGLPDVEGGDKLYQPTNMAPLGFMPVARGSGPGSDLTGEPAQGGDGDAYRLPDEGPAPSV
jgi:HK97 family phage portal protein